MNDLNQLGNIFIFTIQPFHLVHGSRDRTGNLLHLLHRLFHRLATIQPLFQYKIRHDAQLAALFRMILNVIIQHFNRKG
ncbi:hypothetical protein D3C76_1541590 [compost metagenome]